MLYVEYQFTDIVGSFEGELIASARHVAVEHRSVAIESRPDAAASEARDRNYQEFRARLGG